MDRAAGDVLYWIWVSELQIDRFWDGWQHELDHLGTGSSLGPVSRAKVFARFGADQHFLLVALGNLVKAVGVAEGLAAARFTLDGQLRGLIVQLRDLYEHWEKERDRYPGGQTGRKFSGEFPSSIPYSVRLDDKRGAMLGDALELDYVSSSLMDLEGAVIAWISDAD